MTLLAMLLVGALQTPGSPAELASIRVGERVTDVLAAGEAEAGPPAKRWALAVEAAGPVTITLESHDFDALLRVENADGELLAEDDDSGVETDAHAVLELAAGARCVVIALAKDGVGELVLSVRAGIEPAPAGPAALDAGLVWRSTAAARALARGERGVAATHLIQAGRLGVQRSRFADARTAFESARALAREVGDRESEARAIGGLASVCLSTGELARAGELYEIQLASCVERGDLAGEAGVSINLGIIASNLGDFPRALERHQRGLALARQVGQRQWEANALGNLGVVYSRMGDLAQAREHAVQHLALTRELGDRWGEARALQNLGNVHRSLGQTALAQEHHGRHLALARELGDRSGEAQASVNLGIGCADLGEPRLAREHFERGLALAQELGERSTEVNALAGIGNLLTTLGDFASALEHHERRLGLVRALGDRSSEAAASIDLGNVRLRLAEYAVAREHFERGLALAREGGAKQWEAAAVGSLGVLHHLLGDQASAQEHFEQHLALARELGDEAAEAKALGNLGLVRHALGDLTLAGQHLEAQLALTRKVGDRVGEAAALGNLGVLYEQLGDPTRARELHQQQLELSLALGDGVGESVALRQLGEVHYVAGEHVLAQASFERALRLSREIEDHRGELRALRSLARLGLTRGELAGAGEHAAAADVLARELGLPEDRIHALRVLCAVALASGDGAAASAALDEAELLVEESTGAGLEGGEASGMRGRFAALGAAAQDLTALQLANIAAAPGDDTAADAGLRRDAIASGLRAAGRWKGRALLEGIAEHRAGARTAEALELRQRRREALALRLVTLERISEAIRAGAPAAELGHLRAEADAQRAEAEVLAARLGAISPRDAALDLPLGASPAELASALLPPRTLLVEYAEGSERLYAYVLGEGVLELLDLGSRAAISAELERYLAHLRDPSATGTLAELASAGRVLQERLLAPALEAAGAHVEHLAIVPSASLAALPFEALVVEASASARGFAEIVFVIDRFELSYGPSTPVLMELAATPPRAEGGSVLVLADPWYPPDGPLARLPGTREEAFAIAAELLGGEQGALTALRTERSGSFTAGRLELHLGERCSPRRLAGDLRGFSVLHLGCHGQVDAEDPRRTGIALAPEGDASGWFTIGDALELDLDADLVVLSACQTARGEVQAGEGIESLARAFLYSGARGVVASLWQVDDRAAALTMERFYRAWLEEGLRPARALREAKLALRRGALELGPVRGVALGEPPGAARLASDPGHPFFWAPFVHIGLGR